jgi:thymidine phosphorylase
MDAGTIGRISLFLGGGRQTADDTIDLAVGLSGLKKIGKRVNAQESLSFFHARDDQTLFPSSRSWSKPSRSTTKIIREKAPRRQAA